MSVGRTARRRSIRGKLTWLVVASTSLAVALVAVVSTVRDGRREAALQTDHLRATAAVIASLSGEAAAQGDRTRAFAALRSIAALPDVGYARIETPDGVMLAEAGAAVRLTRDAKIAADQDLSLLSMLRSRTVEVSAPVVYARRDVGRVVLLGRLHGVGERLASSLLIGLLAALAATAAGLAVAWRLQRGIAGPILALTRAMGEMRERRDFEQGPDIAADDEVGDLVDGFNAMLAEIRTRDGEIARHVAGLEHTVAQRTSDLVDAKEAADAANSAKSDFLATMSHEIRTPMNGIMVMAEMLAAGDVPPRQRRFAEVIAKSGSSLLAIINDILDFSKIEAGKMDLEAAPVDPCEIADDVCSLFWERARSKGLDLAAYVDPSVPQIIEADAVRLRQVVGNLINNAIKFTESGAVLVELTAPQPGRLRAAVHDTGIGIPADKLSTLFTAFTQADQSTTRRFGGTGLGLAICKRLVEAMGGAMHVRSKVGQGSMFGFEVPVVVIEPARAWPALTGVADLGLEGSASRAAMRRYLTRSGLTFAQAPGDADIVICDPTAAPAASSDRIPTLCVGEYGDSTPAQLQQTGRVDAVLIQPFRRQDLHTVLEAWRDKRPLASALDSGEQAQQAATATFSGRRVLVADDSAVNREVAMEALSRLGIHVSVVVDGREAVRAVAEGGVDLVLMDGSMPELDGYDATREIRAAEARSGAPRLPVVALTAHVVGAAAEAWRDAGMDAVLHKPFTLASLAQTLAKFLTPDETPLAQPEPIPAAEATPQPALDDLLDPNVTAEFAAMTAAGRGEFVERVRRLYRENAPEAAQAAADAARAGDAAELARAAHALKSMSLNMGARAVSELAARLESAARDGIVDHAGAAALPERLAATLAVMEGATPVAEPSRSQTADEEELRLAADLAQAAQRGEFHMVYQPQVARDGETLAGVESLLRWRHPVRGDVSPADFIPIAERHGLIRPITLWVLERVMQETADLAPLSVGFNASALEFGDTRFVDDIAMLIAAHRFEPERLEIEITETAILNDGEEVRRSIERLHSLGVRIALDDFGVGYSSLSHLRMFAFDKLKIDRAFVTECAENVQAATLVHAVVSIGRALGMKVVAEGVETQAQQRFLKTAGVHAMQDYLFGKPAPVEDLRAWTSPLAAVASAV
ncbi:EAL domain-containing protein [Phenylobacterium sp.]|uniref:EAL domain-containing protein n=1 Tax=Phenylobacterium sp. TaxID=1871053 RepID=UPI002735AD91|nr:EAL domain-containing protein [Phenylobacterium sp.]MDP3661001.1 EAL domain-containing protein [Phenylobacterium sp.]